MPNPIPPTVVVTGDHGLDFHLYLPADADRATPEMAQTVLRAAPGGAGLVERVLSAASAESTHPFQVSLAVGDGADAAPSAAVWHPTAIGRAAKDPAAKVWRISRALNLGRVRSEYALPRPVLPADPRDPQLAKSFAAEVLVIEDGGNGCRFKVPGGLDELLRRAPISELPRAIVLRTCAPVGHGELWWLLTSRPELAERLVVVLSAGDLRAADIRISQGISWERTALDLVRELQFSPMLSSLQRARHVVVTLDQDAALWMGRGKDQGRAFKLCFDAAHVEGEWLADAAPAGGVAGSHAAFAAALAASFAVAGESNGNDAIAGGIQRGLLALRVLQAVGHGPVDEKMSAEGPGPAFPAAAMASVLLNRPALNCVPGITLTGLGAFAWVNVPAGLTGETWRILESAGCDRPTSKARLPLYGKARRIALLGFRQLADAPYAIFGRLCTADRDEIESLRNLKRLIEGYQQDAKETKPLSIAVFGPPGAGKSYGIKQISERVVEDRVRAFLEFNLSQFASPSDLIGAFHQVRDKVLEGKLPIVFWDEFDSRSFEWLQYLLAPMQDGKFQEGQLTHPIGRCIFVFAGATSYTCDNFGPPKPTAADTAERKKAYAEFVLRKGPDFISRLHGSLNVLGPNPRQVFIDGDWRDDPTDVCFPVRRAILLRAMLGLMDGKSGSQRLNIDSGLLGAMLEVGHYRYGSRSFEKIVAALKRGASQGYRRSSLPTDEVLAMNVQELDDFKARLDDGSEILPHADVLAAAIHARWLGDADRANTFRREFDALGDETKADNLAAAFRIPAILGMAGLRLAPVGATAEAVPGVAELLQAQIEVLAEEEHVGWMSVRLRNGWKRAARTSDPAKRKEQRQQRLHDCLVPYDQLPEEERAKDRGAILWYPQLAALAGFKIIARQRSEGQRSAAE